MVSLVRLPIAIQVKELILLMRENLAIMVSISNAINNLKFIVKET